MKNWNSANWSGGWQLLARSESKGAWTDLELPVPEDGTYQIVAQMTRAPDFGIIRFSLDGKVVGEPFDGYNPAVVSPMAVSLGRVELKKGTALFRIETVGANPKAIPNRYYCGLDCLVLTPTK
jgi:hypothetical protein